VPAVYGDLDLIQNELRNAVVENLATAPATPSPGQIYFDTDDDTLWWWDGTQWVAAKGGTGTGEATTVADTDTIDLTLTGAEITGAVRIDPVAGNTLSATAAGLSVPAPDLDALPRGIVMRQTVPGTNFASTTPDQWNLTFPGEVGRSYLMHAYASWRATVANTALAFTVWLDGVVQFLYGGTAAIAATATYPESAMITVNLNPTVTNPAMPLRLQSARMVDSAAGTIQVGTWIVLVMDIGSSVGLTNLDPPSFDVLAGTAVQPEMA